MGILAIAKSKLRCHRKEELQDAGAAATDGVESDEVAWGRRKKQNNCMGLFSAIFIYIPNINNKLGLMNLVMMTSKYL